MMTLAAAVAAIHLMSQWGGLGPGRHANVTITCSGQQCAFSDGTRVDSKDVDALVAALTAPASDGVPPAEMDAAKAYLRNSVNAAKSDDLGDLQALSDVRDRFISLYLDTQRMSSFLTTYLGTRSATCCDDYPREQIQVVLDDGSQINATSNNRDGYMLPWDLTIAGSSKISWSPRISLLIGAIFGKRDVNYRRLAGPMLLDDYEGAVDKQLGTVDPMRLLPQAQRALAEAGTRMVDTAAYDGRSRLVFGSFMNPTWPPTVRVRFECTIPQPDAGAQCARKTLRRGRAVERNAMLRRFAVRAGRVDVMPGSIAGDSWYGSAIDSARQLGLAKLSELLISNAFKASFVQIWSGGEAASDSSQWVLLPDGSLLLIGYYPGALDALGIDETSVAGTARFAFVFVGARMNSDGTFTNI